MTALRILLTALIAYIVGSVSTGVLVSKAYGRVDIRSQGSGNVGMTNVMRTLGWLPSFLTFAGDTIKGVLASFIGYKIAGELGLHVGGIMAVIGHNWPLFFSFRGGKGMSTSLGYILVADWRVALILVGVQLAIVLITGFMSAASITTAILLPILMTLWHHEDWRCIVFPLIACLLALYSHRANLKRLSDGTENKLDAQKINETSSKMAQKLRDRRKKKHE
jgi:glycerol-3-phosphate acyltransferase PlsY